jgi:hypothetical protein
MTNKYRRKRKPSYNKVRKPSIKRLTKQPIIVHKEPILKNLLIMLISSVACVPFFIFASRPAQYRFDAMEIFSMIAMFLSSPIVMMSLIKIIMSNSSITNEPPLSDTLLKYDVQRIRVSQEQQNWRDLTKKG